LQGKHIKGAVLFANMSHQKKSESHSPLQHNAKHPSKSHPSDQQQNSNMYTDMSVLGARDNTNTTAQLIRVMIYRGKNSCDQCPESIAELFKCTFPKVNITYAGPDEDVQINADTLSQVDVYAQPGGPGMYMLMTKSSISFLTTHTQEKANPINPSRRRRSNGRSKTIHHRRPKLRL
jgi:hypothetical protein